MPEQVLRQDRACGRQQGQAALGIPNFSGANVGFALTNPLPVPEPETDALMAVGLGMLVLAHRRSGRKQAAEAA